MLLLLILLMLLLLMLLLLVVELLLLFLVFLLMLLLFLNFKLLLLMLMLLANPAIVDLACFSEVGRFEASTCSLVSCRWGLEVGGPKGVGASLRRFGVERTD